MTTAAKSPVMREPPLRHAASTAPGLPAGLRPPRVSDAAGSILPLRSQISFIPLMELHKSKSLLVPSTSYGKLHCCFLDPNKSKTEQLLYELKDPKTFKINRAETINKIYYRL